MQTSQDCIQIRIAKEYSRTPGPRYRTDGNHSGEEFLEDLLIPRFKVAVNAGCKLIVDLDGAAGYATSFLEEAFGGLARRFGPDQVHRTVEFRCSDEPFLIKEIEHYIQRVNQQD